MTRAATIVSRVAAVAGLAAVAACLRLDTGRQPTDAELMASVREAGAKWEALREAVARAAESYFDPDSTKASPDDPRRKLAEELDIRCSVIRWRDRENHQVFKAAVWCAGIVTGGAMKGVLHAEDPESAGLVEVKSCDGKPPWPGCPEHADCVVPVADRPGWYVVCDFDT